MINHIPKLLFYLFICCLTHHLSAQNPDAYFTFDGSLNDAAGNTSNNGLVRGDISYVACGILDSALYLNGESSVHFDGVVTGEFETGDLTISLYFRSFDTDGTRYILSKRSPECEGQNLFSIRYTPSSRTITCLLQEENESDLQARIDYNIDNTSCWQHIALVRDANKVKLYVNGEYTQLEKSTDSRLDILNRGDLILGATDDEFSNNCYGNNESPFEGLIDEFRVYGQALSDAEIRNLYFSPNKIMNSDTTIFLGNDVQIKLNENPNCEPLYSWIPAEGVFNTNEAEPSISPNRVGDINYTISVRDNLIVGDPTGCVASDNINITVIDPESLDCNEVFLPNAFTPNSNGPFKNESFGFSNPFVIPELISFEIFDRWGNRVFFTNNPVETWDGNYRGEMVNPGVFLYKVNYICEEEEKTIIGEVAVIR